MPVPAHEPADEPARVRRRVPVVLLGALALIVLGLTGVAGAAFRLTFTTLERLGRLCGFGDDSSLLPVCLDVAGVMATVVWLWPLMPREARSWARWVAVATIGGSVLGNALLHYLEAFGLRPPWLVVVVVSAVPPAVLGAVVHLAVLVLHGLVRAPSTGDEDDDQGPDGEAGSGADQDERPAFPSPLTSADLDEVLAADVRLWAAWAGDDQSRPAPSRDRVMAAYGVGATRAARVLVDARRSVYDPSDSDPTAQG